ncbi:MAG: DUF4249 domain-containing protein [Bacteroidia bacterium]|nr:DUF4249 domain-containing protein [Bacteroidia bacterium]
MTKLNSLPVFLILSLAIILASCEDVIKLDLKNSPSRTVIEATLNVSKGECMVQVTKSLDFYQIDSFVKVERATVELVNGSGAVQTLPEVSPGTYFAGNLFVSPGEIFRLNINGSDGQKYSAQTKAPEDVLLDSLKVVPGFDDPHPGSSPRYLLNLKWKDPVAVANFYRFKVTTNGKPHSGSFSITNDKFFNGTEVDMPLNRYHFEIGDTVRLEFQSIDSLSYSYYSQINDMARPSFVAATPYNPVGNFDNGALGYFGIYYSDVRDLIISIL